MRSNPFSNSSFWNGSKGFRGCTTNAYRIHLIRLLTWLINFQLLFFFFKILGTMTMGTDILFKIILSKIQEIEKKLK
ncbi:hypothetical protein CEXT_463751, partial [Caerostris extrusa]